MKFLMRLDGHCPTCGDDGMLWESPEEGLSPLPEPCPDCDGRGGRQVERIEVRTSVPVTR